MAPKRPRSPSALDVLARASKERAAAERDAAAAQRKAEAARKREEKARHQEMRAREKERRDDARARDIVQRYLDELVMRVAREDRAP